MNRRSIQALLALGCFMLMLVSCAPGRSESEVAAVVSTPTPKPPTATPKRATPTPKSSTATPQPPTPTVEPPSAPTSAPPSSPAEAEPSAQEQPIDAPAGWKHYDKSAAGFRFALPPQWRVIDLDRDDANALIDEMLESMPEMKQFGGTTGDLLAQGIKAIACDCSAAQAGAMPTNMNIIVQPLPSPVAFDDAVEGAINSLQALPFTIKPIKHTRIPHPTVDAEAIQYRTRLTGPDGMPRTFTATQYLLVHDRTIVIVTITASIAKAEELTPTFYKIIQTFRLTSF